MTDGPARVYLVGFMGSGKTRVGRVLAGHTEARFEDTDARVVRREGRAIDRIFAESGEAYFRELEMRELREVAEGPEGVVVATGGGAFARHSARTVMNGSGVTVWLDVPLGTLRRRLGDGDGRPLWDPADPVGARAAFERRRAAYALADARVAAAEHGPEAVAARVLERIGTIFR